MDIEILREYIHVARRLNITRAAIELHLTPSALSRHMSGLERAVGSTLIVRQNPMHLTSAGSLLLEEASRVVACYDEMVSHVASLSKSSHRVRVAYLSEDRAVTDAVSIARSRMVQQEANTLISAVRPVGCSIVEAVERGDADVGITYKPDDLNADVFEAVRVVKDSLVVATRKDNAIATEASLEASQLDGLTFLYPTARCFDDYYKHILELFNGHDIHLNVKYISADTAEEFYAHDEKQRLWCFTQSSFSESRGRILPLHAYTNSNLYEIKTEGFVGDRYAMYRKDSKTEAVVRFVELLRDVDEGVVFE